MTTKITHDTFKKELLSDPEVQAVYEELEEEFQLLDEMIRARKKAGMTQAKIAKSMKTTTSVVSRLEAIPTRTKHSPSFATLKKYAHAVGCKLSVKFVPQ